MFRDTPYSNDFIKESVLVALSNYDKEDIKPTLKELYINYMLHNRRVGDSRAIERILMIMKD